jgi:hypothetical protein
MSPRHHQPDPLAAARAAALDRIASQLQETGRAVVHPLEFWLTDDPATRELAEAAAEQIGARVRIAPAPRGNSLVVTVLT